MSAWGITFDNLTLGYGNRVILNEISATLPAGKMTVILGGSGCGKSTLLKHIIGLYHPIGGKILLRGQDLFSLKKHDFRRVRRHMGVLFQDGALLGALTLAQNVALPLSENTRLSYDKLKKAAQDTLKLVGLENFGDYYPNELSGGMRKRAGLARAIITEPSILLCDEPTSGLDPITAAQMDQLLLDMHSRYTDMTTVVVSHDLDSVRRIADYVLVLRDGTAVFSGTYIEMTQSRDPYLSQFLHREANERNEKFHAAQTPEIRAALDAWRNK